MGTNKKLLFFHQYLLGPLQHIFQTDCLKLKGHNLVPRGRGAPWVMRSLDMAEGMAGLTGGIVVEQLTSRVTIFTSTQAKWILDTLYQMLSKRPHY